MLIDTNVIIYYLNGDQVAVDFISRYVSNILAISFITKIEVMSYPYTAEEENVVERFLGQFKLIMMDDSMLKESYKLRRQKKVPLADAIIAATAIVNHQKLVTRNTSDFKNIERLHIINPYELIK
jgi:hypothetical protein